MLQEQMSIKYLSQSPDSHCTLYGYLILFSAITLNRNFITVVYPPHTHTHAHLLLNLDYSQSEKGTVTSENGLL